MIARFKVLLPYSFSVPIDSKLVPFECSYRGEKVRFFPPAHSGITDDELDSSSPIPHTRIFERMRTPPLPSISAHVTVDDRPTYRANLLIVEIIRESFQRARTSTTGNPDPKELLKQGDPPIGFLLNCCNEYLVRLRGLHRASFVQPLTLEKAFWTLQYLADDGSDLPPDPALFRGRFSAPIIFRNFGVNEAVWDEFSKLPDGLPARPWLLLLLDAGELLPDVGAALAVANTALEAFSIWLCNEMANRSPVPEALWRWINERGDWYKEPSVAERFDALLAVLCGKSLKSEKVLWESFKNLRAARNSFAHEGVAVLGGQPVDVARARELINDAHKIVEWIETLIPPELRAIRTGVKVTIEVTKVLHEERRTHSGSNPQVGPHQ